MQVFGVFFRSGKAAVEVADERFKPGVGVINAGDVIQPHLLNQPVLQRQIGSFDTPFGLRTVGTDKVNV